MIASVVNRNFEVHDFVARQNAVLRSFLNSLVDRLNIFLGNAAADRFVHEFVSLAGFLRFEADFTMTVLTVTAALPFEQAFRFDSLTDRLFIGNLRRADVGFHAELS